MAERHVNEYRPDSVSLPGETLQEVLDERQMSQAELAERMGRPKKTVNEIVQGKTAITPETAVQLERVLGVPAGFWNNLERNYREHKGRKQAWEVTPRPPPSGPGRGSPGHRPPSTPGARPG